MSEYAECLLAFFQRAETYNSFRTVIYPWVIPYREMLHSFGGQNGLSD